ncbi:acyl-CoA dehydrogenase [Streptomyces sp. CS113]|uniref:acyl-CoA dehydrogenase family protein n=1 Tax=Streptomyces sp. CS113 TaxID=1982761 RepID=UPI000B41C05D|nr:acyl-CoA dehydrogenase family protein [Streptomyces sp. CS113]OWA12343.1 acyl-CoA dehydrogenase [Streptomyces sp. CS113]
MSGRGGTWPGTGTLRAAAGAAGRGAQEADAAGRLAADTVEALAAAGFAAAFGPPGAEGAGASFGQVTEAVAAIGEGCTSAAWIASLWAYNGRFSAYLPTEGRQEVWAKGPDTRLVSSMVAAGVEAEPTDGGWTLSGTWLYVSGVEFADWALLSSALPREGDRSVRVFAVPKDSFTHRETWSTLGMRATGSHTLAVDGAFVPAHRSFLWDDMRQGDLPGPASAVHTAPLFAVNGLTFAAPVLGAARGALALVGQHLGRPPSGPRAAAHETSRIAYARAAGEIDAAALLLSRVAETADRGLLSEEGAAQRCHRDSTLAVEMLVGAVDRLFHVTGTRGQATSHGMQRIWRDAHAAGSHAALQFEPAALGYTRGLLPA